MAVMYVHRLRTRTPFSVSLTLRTDFEVKDPLPNVTFPLPRSFAGNIAVNRPNHPNDTLFFWGFEKSNGSLTSNSSTDPWGIWLNGGCVSAIPLGPVVY
jgi:carboxypeptidase D